MRSVAPAIAGCAHVQNWKHASPYAERARHVLGFLVDPR